MDTSCWWLTYPSEKWWSEFVSWDDLPNWMEKSKSCSKAPTRFRYTYIWYDETCVWWSSPFLYHMQRHQIVRKRDEFTALWNAGNAYGTTQPFCTWSNRLCLENGPKNRKVWNSLPQTWNSYWQMLVKCNSQHTLDIFTGHLFLGAVALTGAAVGTSPQCGGLLVSQ